LFSGEEYVLHPQAITTPFCEGHEILCQTRIIKPSLRLELKGIRKDLCVGIYQVYRLHHGGLLKVNSLDEKNGIGPLTPRGITQSPYRRSSFGAILGRLCVTTINQWLSDVIAVTLVAQHGQWLTVQEQLQQVSNLR
jgi:hypothetical protein